MTLMGPILKHLLVWLVGTSATNLFLFFFFIYSRLMLALDPGKSLMHGLGTID